MTPKTLKDKAEQAFTKRDRYKPLFQDAYDYTMPTRQGFDHSDQIGLSRTDRIFDETAVVGVTEFAAELQSSLIPPFARWANLVAGSDIEDKDEAEEINAELQRITEKVFDHIANSNFDQEVNEALHDLAVGTGVLNILPGDAVDPLRFQAIPLTEIAIEDGPDGLIDDVHYRKFCRVDHIPIMFPDTPKEVLETIQHRNSSNDQIEVIQSTMRDRSTANVRNWDYVAHIPSIETELARERYSGRGSNPWVLFRWSKAAGESYGRGPVINALPAIRTCNLVVQLILENADMAVTGMWQADDDGVINPDSINLRPGIIIPRAPGSRIDPLQTPARFDVGQLVLDDMRHNIKKALYNQQLGRPHEATPMSATEVAERMAQLAQEIGPAFGRLMKELVEPVIQRVVYIMKKKGLIEIPTINGKAIKIVSQSPLAAAQRMQDVTNMDQFMQRMVAIFGPQITQVLVDQDETARWYAERQQVPFKLLRDPEQQASLLQNTIGDLAPVLDQQRGEPQ
ncbi:MAG: hypothetical protein CMG35_11185 [Candidatus Marinimicrobia bacterium]|nr:hypothetical protein [Candidatus Neomarinimicrobiota bacterium]|tara:strand:+ start:1765 stop:3297 length:1533 start_codon:yes stop_codon:yes gene_type:complete